MARLRRKWCGECGRTVAAARTGGGLSFGLVDLALALLTLGLWLLLWLAVAFVAGFLGLLDPRSKWVCPHCGSRV
jgi:DNA-directed RNA polymerase subunit RPC12/RpoP